MTSPTPTAMNAASPSEQYKCDTCKRTSDIVDLTNRCPFCSLELYLGQGSATSGEAVATYEQRIAADPSFNGVRSKEHMFDYLLAEIADLRAALAAKAEQPCGGTGCRDLSCLSCGGSGAAPVAERAAAPASVPDGYKLVPDAANADEIVTRLYRRFKDWSKRGFGPDDVTWCEVKADVLALLAAPEVAQPAAQGEADCYCGGFGDVHQNGCPEIEAPAPTAGEPSADELMFVGHEFLKWNRSQPTPPVAACKELYIARKVLELRAAHIKATQGEPLSEEAVRGTAEICGSHSAAAQALADAAQRRQAGEEVGFFLTRGSIVVASIGLSSSPARGKEKP